MSAVVQAFRPAVRESTMKRLILSLACASLLGVVVTAADVLQQVLVKVNGEIITKTDFEQLQVSALRQRNQQFTDDDSLKKAIAEITPQLIVDAVDDLLLQQRGREMGLKLGDEQFKNIVDNIKKENKLETEEQFQAALKQEGMTMADLRKALERQMLRSQVQQQEVMSKVGVSEEEAKAYYETHQAEFTSKASLTLREILVEVPEVKTSNNERAVSVGIEEEAKEKIEKLRARALAGEDFALLAGEASDAPSKANGGLVGPLNHDELAPAFRELVDKLSEGGITEPIRTQRGFQLLKLESAAKPTVEGFDQARPKIADRVVTDKRRAEMERYLRKLREQAIIEWKNDELKKAYEQQLASQVTTSSEPAANQAR